MLILNLKAKMEKFIYYKEVREKREKKEKQSVRPKKSLGQKTQTESVRPKKSLGQNFLNSKTIIKKIVEAGNVFPGDTILEIGPGKGILTNELLEKGAVVIALEKDHRLIELLEEKFKDYIEKKMLILKNVDVLEYDTREINSAYKIIANIPYYITGEILEKFLSNAHQPMQMVLLVQREVATRIVARDNKESILSLSIKAYGTPRIVMKVQKKYFTPSPKVDSAVISIEDISKERLGTIGEFEFFKIIKEGFKHKRKILAQNLSTILPKENVVEIFERIGLNPMIRAEDIDFPTWLYLIEALNNTLLNNDTIDKYEK